MRIWTSPEFHSAVYALCLIHAASVTSGVRSAARNRAKGGAATSEHLEDLASDLVCDERRDQPRLAADARKLGLVAIEESDHVHIQAYTRAAHERLRALLADA